MRVTATTFSLGQIVLFGGEECTLKSPPASGLYERLLIMKDGNLKETDLWTLGLENPPVHFFDSTEEAHNSFVCDPAVRFGDVIVVSSEGVVGVSGHGVFAVTEQRGCLPPISEAFRKDKDMERRLNKAIIAARFQTRLLNATKQEA
jgi:hypothetical protein